ncbi:MAG TPA: cytidine deaminase [Bacteroidota bacterium]|jgi:cytidine deaminase|nr:cytidine deaminase [Bacteroidota bacterium]
MPEKHHKQLKDKARSAKKRSYSPYSKFRVGAALLDSAGRIFTGANIENSSFSLTICAERVALFKALSEGSKKFKAIAITSDSESFIPPCGACRQVLFELAGNIEVLLVDKRGRTMHTKVGTLLPLPFTEKYLHT